MSCTARQCCRSPQPRAGHRRRPSGFLLSVTSPAERGGRAANGQARPFRREARRVVDAVAVRPGTSCCRREAIDHSPGRSRRLTSSKHCKGASRTIPSGFSALSSFNAASGSGRSHPGRGSPCGISIVPEPVRLQATSLLNGWSASGPCRDQLSTHGMAECLVVPDSAPSAISCDLG